MSNPWGKFFWSDWETDAALKLCSFAAQGLWMRMLCVAAQHDPIGLVAVNGQALDALSIARMTGGTAPEVSALIDELDRNGVFSRDRSKRIYSRRMVRDAKLSRTRAESGFKGAAVTNGKQKEKSGLPQQNIDKVVGKLSAKGSAPEARSQKEEEPTAALPVERDAREPESIPRTPLAIVMAAARMTSFPSDGSLVGEWQAAGADLQLDIVPVVERITAEVIGREGRGPFKLKLFDEAVRRRVDEQTAEVERRAQSITRMRKIETDQESEGERQAEAERARFALQAKRAGEAGR